MPGEKEVTFTLDGINQELSVDQINLLNTGDTRTVAQKEKDKRDFPAILEEAIRSILKRGDSKSIPTIDV